MVRAGLREAEASAVGLVLPVRTIWDVVRVGMRCPLHALPHGWEEAHERFQQIARPLRHALADRPLEDNEAL
jgi:hypothetical protein